MASADDEEVSVRTYRRWRIIGWVTDILPVASLVYFVSNPAGWLLSFLGALSWLGIAGVLVVLRFTWPPLILGAATDRLQRESRRAGIR